MPGVADYCAGGADNRQAATSAACILAKHGFGDAHIAAFQANGLVTAQDLIGATTKELKRLGVGSIKDINKLMKAARRIDTATDDSTDVKTHGETEDMEPDGPLPPPPPPPPPPPLVVDFEKSAREQAKELAAAGMMHVKANRVLEAVAAYSAAVGLEPAPNVHTSTGTDKFKYRYLNGAGTSHVVSSVQVRNSIIDPQSPKFAMNSCSESLTFLASVALSVWVLPTIQS
eukprot:SAG22_NODE_738_length_7524_cov_57.525522_8_plen_230_part_00